jgi:hypothetical protein
LLDRPDRFIAEPLGVHGLVDGVAVAVRGRLAVTARDLVVNTELHDRVSFGRECRQLPPCQRPTARG